MLFLRVNSKNVVKFVGKTRSIHFYRSAFVSFLKVRDLFREIKSPFALKLHI